VVLPDRLASSSKPLGEHWIVTQQTPQPWLSSRPPERTFGSGIVLARAVPEDCSDLVAAVNESLDHLRPWMPWAQEPATDASIGEFLAGASEQWHAGTEFQFCIRSEGGERIIGCCGLHDRVGPGVLEIGYWVRSGHLRHGVATEAARLLTEAALSLTEVLRTEIHVDEANEFSMKIPPKVGYRLDRTESREPESPARTGRTSIWVRDSGTV
jgi:RimJ/RimL family protein N-acetyltransferase